MFDICPYVIEEWQNRILIQSPWIVFAVSAILFVIFTAKQSNADMAVYKIKFNQHVPNYDQKEQEFVNKMLNTALKLGLTTVIMLFSFAIGILRDR